MMAARIARTTPADAISQRLYYITMCSFDRIALEGTATFALLISAVSAAKYTESVMKAEWRDLEDKGFLIVPQFLSAGELDLVRGDYDRQSGASYKGGNYSLPFATKAVLDHLEPKIQSVSEAVLAATGIDTDVTVSGMYFAIDRGVKTPWHQDHESYFLFQEHRHYLNFYIPIVKPKTTETNVCVIPFDALQKDGPEFYSRLKGGGASVFITNGVQTTVRDDDADTSYVMPFDIDRLAVTPNLNAGDLLLLRGDMIHRTQDTNTARVAISFRRISTKSVIRHSKFMARGRLKSEIMSKGGPLCDRIAQCFTDWNRSELTVGEVLPHIGNFLRGEPAKPRA